MASQPTPPTQPTQPTTGAKPLQVPVTANKPPGPLEGPLPLAELQLDAVRQPERPLPTTEDGQRHHKKEKAMPKAHQAQLHDGICAGHDQGSRGCSRRKVDTEVAASEGVAEATSTTEKYSAKTLKSTTNSLGGKSSRTEHSHWLPGEANGSLRRVHQNPGPRKVSTEKSQTKSQVKSKKSQKSGTSKTVVKLPETTQELVESLAGRRTMALHTEEGHQLMASAVEGS